MMLHKMRGYLSQRPGSTMSASGVAWQSRLGQRPVITGGRHEVMEALVDVLQAFRPAAVVDDVVEALVDVLQAFLVTRACGQGEKVVQPLVDVLQALRPAADQIVV